jgi:tetratricopeptide (TPR) repeat protein
MPLRPPEHQLEAESRTAFQAALPPAWVFRDMTPDYGLDGAVEVFEEDGAHTGDSFYVQLKARSEDRLDRAFRLRFTHDTADYYARQALPVLIVGYHAPTKLLYHKWFHSFDPHYGGEGKTGVTFRLTEEHEWTEHTPAQLATEVRAFRRWRSSRLTLPVPFTLAIEGESIHGIPVDRMAMTIANVAAPANEIVEITGQEVPENPTIRVSNDGIVVDFHGVSSITTHKTDYEAGADERFACDVMVAIGLGFGQLGDVNTAARLVRRFGATAPLLDFPDVLFRCVGFFVQAHRVVDALRLAEDLREEHENGHVLSQMMFTAALAQAPAMTPDEIEDVRIHLVEAASQADAAGEADDARVAHYRLGNWLRANKRWDEAFVHYSRAAESDPTYLDRPYFTKELAGIFFMLGDYESAVTFYTQAIDHGEDAGVLLADALLHRGRYKEGLDVLRKSTADGQHIAARWRLLGWALSRAMAALGVEEQERNPEAAADQLKTLEGKIEDALVAELCTTALQKDLLTPLAWFNLGVLLHKQGDPNASLYPCALAGLLEPNDSTAWCNATLTALASDAREELFTLVVEAAYDSSGPRFLQAFAAFLETQKEGFPTNEVMAAVVEIIRNAVKEQPGFDLRFLMEDGTYKTLPVQRPPRRPPI